VTRVDVKAREKGGAAERCPYCHDALVDEVAPAAEVRCDGCGTSHHEACIEELGRCTVFGCARPLVAPPVELVEGKPVRPRVRSRFFRDLQARVRARARSFVQTQSSQPTAREELAGLLELALDQAERAMSRAKWAAAAEWWGEAARLETIARPGDLDHARRRIDADRGREIASALQTIHHLGWLRQRSMIVLIVVLMGLALVGAVTILM
jgi:hypothetical protein